MISDLKVVNDSKKLTLTQGIFIFSCQKKSQSLAYIYPFTTLDTKLDF